jgi:hypothetical protein
LQLSAEGMHFPRPSDGKRTTTFEWCPIRYRSIIGILKNPFYAGVYAYGKSEKRTTLVEGQPHRSYGHGKPLEQWEVLIKDHHEGYITWAEFERNQTALAANNFRKPGECKSGRGGRALLAGIIRCGRCGRQLSVFYGGRGTPRPVYRCELPNAMLGLPRCLGFGGSRVDAAVAAELLRALEPMAIDAAHEAERVTMEAHTERIRMFELELQQARYEASLAERRYAACDPDNRLIAAQLERGWETALRRVEEFQARLDAALTPRPSTPTPDFVGLAEDLSAAWNAPGTTTRTRQRLMRALIREIVADVDEAAREVVLVIHWRGGQHSELRVRKPRTGEHGCRTPEEALAVMRSMAARWSDEDIAASLNRMGMRTGQGKSWTAKRVSSLRRVHGIHAYRSAEKDGEWLTMSEAAASLGTTSHSIRKLIKDGILPAEQVVADAPWQIQAADLRSPRVVEALAARRSPRRSSRQDELPIFSGT